MDNTMPYEVTPERAAKDLKHLRTLIDEYIQFAVRMQIPDAMTPLLHMHRDLGLLDQIIGAWSACDHHDRKAKWQQIAADKNDRRGNR